MMGQNKREVDKNMRLKKKKTILTVCIIIYIVLALLIILSVRIENVYLRLGICCPLSVVCFVGLFHVNKCFTEISRLMIGIEENYVRTGLFAELWAQYESDRLCALTNAVRAACKLKYVNIYDCRNAIDIRFESKTQCAFVNLNEEGFSIAIGNDNTKTPSVMYKWNDYTSVSDVFDCIVSHVTNALSETIRQ